MFKSIEPFKSSFPFFLECRTKYSSKPLSVSSQVIISTCCIIYICKKSYLQMLDPIHNQGLRLALRAFRTSPVAFLYVEGDEPSLYSRKEKLSLQNAVILAA